MVAKLDENIGTAKDNRNEPIHDWYRFTAGFSFKLVEKIISEEKLSNKDKIYESFAGCGTTLVSAQKKGIKAIGNEAQELLFDVIRAKLNWKIDAEEIHSCINKIKGNLKRKRSSKKFHKLLKTLYSEYDLDQLYLIKKNISKDEISETSYLFMKLALTQSLHKVCIHPISVPYISRSKTLSHEFSAWDVFKATTIKMLEDLEAIETKKKTSNIYLHDSREKNSSIRTNSCSISITSPPYLNNLDYGEVSKVCSHFFGITDNWNDITEKVRKKLVTGATTHYKNSEFDYSSWKQKGFYKENNKIIDALYPSIKKIERESKKRKGKKSFHILALYYFEDMFYVLREMRRVLKKNAKAYLVLGDSAPYGVFIDTTKILGEIALSVGFSKYKIIKIRDRGTKWKLTYRHNLKLSENILILE